MTPALFLYTNLISSATLTASSENALFPASNLKNPFRTKVWRTDGATDGTAQLVIDHGAAKAVTCVAMANYTWASAPGTLDIEFNATDAWGAPTAHEHITWSAHPTANGNNGIIIKTFASQSYRYNRLSVVYSPAAVPTDWDLGILFVGTYFQPTRNYSIDWGQDLVDESIRSRSIGGQDHFDEVDKYRQVKANLLLATQAQWELFQTMFNTVGLSKDMIVAFDYDNEPNEMSIYGKFGGLPNMQVTGGKYFQVGISFTESR